MQSQTTSRVLMIRPARFGANPETAATNAYQRPEPDAERAAVQERAEVEFERFAEALREAGAEVIAFEDTPEPHTPDAVFPNNWVSFHEDGTVVLYPLLAPSRRREVRPELLQRLADERGLRWPRLVDLTGLGREGAFLEGTGSLVLDRAHRTAYACLSPRTTERGLAAFESQLGYGVVAFRAADRGADVYHTNVLMGIGEAFAAVCLESIGEEAERRRVREGLEGTGHELVLLEREQVRAFAGNLLALRSSAGDPLIALSTGALRSLAPLQRRALERHGRLVHAPLPTLEAHGGGSARCMLAELHAPP